MWVSGRCWWEDGFWSDSCKECSSLSGCGDYTDARACSDNPCQVPGGCYWDTGSTINPWDNECKPAKLSLLFVPMNWVGSRTEFNNVADAQITYFINETPLAKCPEKVSITKMDPVNENHKNFSCLDSLNKIRDFAGDKGYNPDDYDIVAGLVRPQDYTCEYPAIDGLSNQVDTVWINTKEDHITAHEIGHMFGLWDEYCSNPAGSAHPQCNDGGDPRFFHNNIPNVNPLTAAQPMNCPPDGSLDSQGYPCCNCRYRCANPDGCYCFDKTTLLANYNDIYVVNCSPTDSCTYGRANINYGICCQGNMNTKGGRCIMSYTDAPGPRHFCDECKNHLASIPQLQC